MLQEEDKITIEDQAMEGRSIEKGKERNLEQTQNNEYQKEATMSDAKKEIDQEMTQNDKDPKEDELLEIVDKENLELEGFLR